jgi:hypothetical protein
MDSFERIRTHPTIIAYGLCNGAELKNVMERFIQKIKDRTEYALMTIFLVEKRNVIDNTSITG